MYSRLVIQDSKRLTGTESFVSSLAIDPEDQNSILFGDGFSVKKWKGGTVYPVAGATFHKGFTNLAGSKARLTTPSSLLHLNGSKWLIADTGNNCIRGLDLANGALHTYLQHFTDLQLITKTIYGGFYKPSCLLRDPLENRRIFILDANQIWSLNMLGETTVGVHYSSSLSDDLPFTSVGFYGGKLLATSAQALYRINISREDVEFTYNGEIGWKSISLIQDDPTKPEYRGLARLDGSDLFFTLDLTSSVIHLLDFEKKSQFVVCNKSGNKSRDISGCILEKNATAVLYDSHSSALYIGNGAEISKLDGNLSTYKQICFY